VLAVDVQRWSGWAADGADTSSDDDG
jgi:hypothetical protein